MLGLVEYDSSDGEGEETSVAEDSATSSGSIILISPSKRASSKLPAQETALENIVLRKSWEKEEAPKPPAKKKARFPARIAIPEIPANESDEDDEDEPVVVAKKAEKSGPACSLLLSSLPPPSQSSFAMKKKIPKLDNEPEPVKPAKTSGFSNLIPPSVQKKFKQPDIRENNPKPSKQAIIDDVEDPDLDSTDACGFFSTVVVDDQIYEQPDLPEPVPVSDEYDYPASSSDAVYIPEDTFEEPVDPLAGIPAEVADAIRRDPKAMAEFGRKGVVDASADSLLGNVQEQLLRNLSHEQLQLEMMSKNRNAPQPSQKQRQKHQITYLAHLAKEREATLQQQWAANKMMRRSAQTKYGFI